MLSAARQRRAAGIRVVVGWVDAHGRSGTIAAMADMDIHPPRQVGYHGREYPEVDVEGLLASEPDLVVIDELAHSWPGVQRRRWEDVTDVLNQGIDVLTALNVANLDSTREYAARITGAGGVEAVPDDLVRSGEVILVDPAPDVLRRRLVSGAVFSAEQVGGALGQYFRFSNLEALSELAKGWVDGEVETVGEDLLARRGLAPLATRPVVLAGVSESAWGEAVILRGAQLACDEDSELVVVHANVSDGSARTTSPASRLLPPTGAGTGGGIRRGHCRISCSGARRPDIAPTGGSGGRRPTPVVRRRGARRIGDTAAPPAAARGQDRRGDRPITDLAGAARVASIPLPIFPSWPGLHGRRHRSGRLTLWL